MRWGLLAALAVVASCAGPKGPRQVDMDAWKDVPVTELEVHPHYSILPHTTRTTSDGRQVLDYRRCESWVEDRRCHVMAGTNWANVNCRGGESGVSCCHSVFVVNGDTIESMSVQSTSTTCRTSCALRPSSRPCSPDEAND